MRPSATLLHTLRDLGRLLRRLAPDPGRHFDHRAGHLQSDRLLDAGQLEVLARGLGLELGGQLPTLDRHR